MSQAIEVKVPDIGDYTDIPVIEVLVKVGDTVEKEQSLVTLESDKATMDVPSSAAGVVKEVKVKVGDNVSEGALIVVLEAADSGAAAAPKAAEKTAQEKAPAAAAPAASSGGGSVEVKVPDIGDFKDIPVIEVNVKVGDKVEKEQSLVTLESDKATMDVPSPAAGTVKELKVKVGDNVSEGTLILVLEGGEGSAPAAAAPKQEAPKAAAPAGGGELNLLPWPKVDFTKFGPVDPKPLSRIKKISGANLHRNWVMIPHVTNNDEADITDLEALRVTLNKENEKAGVKFTMLAFVIKAVVAALKKFPTFNASLDGDNLVFKQYYNVGFAADTPNGLMVPVIRDADKKGLIDVAREMADLSKAAREGKLKPDQMQGGCFSISSLGGIGGTHFTPIINAPEVAILGLSRGAMKPVWDGKAFVPRLILPLSLSYDHRVIDGAEAARFNAYLSAVLADFRRVSL